MISSLKSLNANYAKDGFSLLKSIFNASESAYFKETTEKSLSEKAKRGNGVEVWASSKMPKELNELVYHEQIINEIKSIYSASQIEFLSCKAVFKSSEVSYESPWHQDRLYWGGCEKISAWVALDDATVENGCLRVIPGTHKELVDHLTIEKAGSFINRIENQSLENAIDVEMQKGDVLLFNDLLIHASHKNISGRDRYSLIATYRVANGQDDSYLNKTLWQNPVLIG